MSAGLVTYEERLNADANWALLEGCGHFDQSNLVFATLRRITERLESMDVDHAVIGALGLFLHGYRRVTVSVDLLVSPAGWERVRREAPDKFPVDGPNRLRDRETGVRIVFKLAGAFPGDGKPKRVVFPDPAAVSIRIGEASCAKLPTLIELKLASGMMPSRRKDHADVQDTIRVLRLRRSFAEQLDPFVRPLFIELWTAIKDAPNGGAMKPQTPGGIIHTYQKYDPVNLPSPRAEPPDLVSPAFEHLLAYGDMDDFTAEQLANAIHIDPSQIKGLGPTLDSLKARLLERKRKILDTYETDQVQVDAAIRFREQAQKMEPPGKLGRRFKEALREEQLHELEELYFAVGDERQPFARDLVQLLDKLGAKYQIDELAGKYAFTGQQALTVPEALEVKEELELIDKLLKQLEEAKKTAQLAIIDLDEMREYADPGDLEQLRALQQQVEDYIQEEARRQGLEKGDHGFQLTPKAFRIFQSRLLETIFSDLQAARSGRHTGPILGEGAVETMQTKSYEFGDSVTHMDLPQTLINALVRQHAEKPVAAGSPDPAAPADRRSPPPSGAGDLRSDKRHGQETVPQPGETVPQRPRIRLKAEDIVIHKTKNNPKCATAVLMDMSGSMRYGGLYINVKRMALALEGLIRKDFPGDFLQFVEMYSFAKLRRASEVVGLMPKPVTIFSSRVRLKQDMSKPDVSEWDIPHHFTNIQHALQLARQTLSVQDTPNRQIILITDGLPTAHFDGKILHLLYPPDPLTEEATLREAQRCARAGITINIFLLSSWNQSEEDVHFAYRLAESTKGRVFFVAGRELDRFVLWDYLKRRRQIIA